MNGILIARARPIERSSFRLLSRRVGVALPATDGFVGGAGESQGAVDLLKNHRVTASLPARRLSVRMIKEVLRLRFELGLGLRAIRLVHNAHRIEMRGDSMRKNKSKAAG